MVTIEDVEVLDVGRLDLGSADFVATATAAIGGSQGVAPGASGRSPGGLW